MSSRQRQSRHRQTRRIVSRGSCRAGERNGTGTRQSDFLLFRGHNLEVNIIVKRYGFLGRHVIRHRLEQTLASASPALASEEAANPSIKVKASPDLAAVNSPLGSRVTFVILGYLYRCGLQWSGLLAEVCRPYRRGPLALTLPTATLARGLQRGSTSARQPKSATHPYLRQSCRDTSNPRRRPGRPSFCSPARPGVHNGQVTKEAPMAVFRRASFRQETEPKRGRRS